MKTIPASGGASALAPKRQTNWDWRAATNFIAGGAGGGLLLAAAGASQAGGDVRIPVLLALALIGLGLTCVWFEIGRPWRALNVYRHIQTSWMTREAAVAPFLFAAGGLLLLTAQVALAWLTGLLGLAFLYSQARMLRADKGIPAWRHPRCLPVVVSTGLTEGAGLLVLTHALVLTDFGVGPALAPERSGWLVPGLVLLLALRLALWRAYLAGLAGPGIPDGTRRELHAINSGFAAAGHWLPVVLALAAWAGAPAAATLLLLAALLAVASGWHLKYTLVRRAAFTPGFDLRHLPVRGKGDASLFVTPRES
ncbi:MAG: phenylacetyl-CoA:acceptor oxidoreductase [Gammaproteobacteria bacterium]|nr:phenylacetyl-CoA:acceptor oxidoreductase [Gammaproteobacteria bacterium]